MNQKAYSIDLHTHSTASDGTNTPSELVKLAISHGKLHHTHSILSLTDHDTVSGIKEFMDESSKYPNQITAIPGLEFSTYYKEETIHILGYGIDQSNPHLLSSLQHYRDSRDGRNEKIIQKLQEHGISITMEDIMPKNPEDSIGRPLMAQYMLRHNYVSSIKEAFNRYLGDGKCCYVERERPTPEEVVSLIHEAGGIAVMAHPVLYKKLSFEELKKFTCHLKEIGLDGMEIYYSRNSQEDTTRYMKLADSLGLLHTGGSDYHGSVKPDLSLFTGAGDLNVKEEVLTIMQALGMTYKK